MKYIIKNCYAINGFYTCTSCVEKCKNVNCLLKQIVEKCKKTIKIFSAESGTHPYAGGRCTESESILQLLDIQEIEE